MARPKRKDKTRTVLRTGELQRSDGSYQYSWTDENHKRRYVYSKTLEALRIKEEAIEKDKSDGIKAEARYVTLDDLHQIHQIIQLLMRKVINFKGKQGFLSG